MRIRAGTGLLAGATALACAACLQVPEPAGHGGPGPIGDVDSGPGATTGGPDGGPAGVRPAGCVALDVVYVSEYHLNGPVTGQFPGSAVVINRDVVPIDLSGLTVLSTENDDAQTSVGYSVSQSSGVVIEPGNAYGLLGPAEAGVVMPVVPEPWAGRQSPSFSAAFATQQTSGAFLENVTLGLGVTRVDLHVIYLVSTMQPEPYSASRAASYCAAQ